MSKQPSRLFQTIYPTPDGNKPPKATFQKASFDNSKANKTLWSIDQLEEKWYQEVNNYLFGKPTLDNYAEWYKHIQNNYIGQYRKYNNDYYSQFGSQLGNFTINDITLTIPPESISVEVNNNTIDIPVLRSKSSVKIDTGMGEVSIMISIPFADNPIYGLTLEDELKYKLIPILTQLKTMPFCHVDNAYLKDKIIQGANTLYDDDKKLSVSDVPELMLTYQNYRLSTVAESPRIVRVDLSFLLFNYKAYMNTIEYPTYYEMDNTKRKMINNIPIAEGKVKSTSRSLPFYQFYAKEFAKREEALHYVHQKDSDKLLEMNFYEYTSVPTYLLTPEHKKLLINLEKETLNETREEGTGVEVAIIPIKEFSDKALTVIDFFVKQGWSKEQAAGIAGNLYVESEFKIDAKGDGGKAYGLAQWHPDRQQLFAKKFNKPIQKSTFAEQLAFINYELNHTKISAGDKLKSAKDTKQAASIFDQYYEISTGEHRQRRIDYAAAYYKKYNENKSSSNNTKTSFDLSSYLNQDPVFKRPELSSVSQNLPKFDISNPLYLGKTSFSENQFKTIQIQKPDTSSVFYDADNPDYIKQELAKQQADLKFEKEMQQKISELAKIPGVAFIQINSTSKQTYVRIPKKLTIPPSYGIEITAIEAFGGHEIARIPLSASRYAAHQYMGGSIDKVVIQLIIYDELGDFAFRQIQNTFNQVSENALKFKNFAAFDGVLLKENFINNIIGGKYYVLDSLRTETHPDIPGASLATLVLTDFTKTKEQAERALRWDQINPDFGYEAYYRSVIQELLSKIDMSAYTYDISAVDKTTLEVGAITSYHNTQNKVIEFKRPRISFKISNIDNYEEILKECLLDLQTTLNDAELLLDEKYNDAYEIMQFINTTNSKDSDAILKALNNKDGDSKFYVKLQKWVRKWSKKLSQYKFRNGEELLPKTNKIFTDDVKASLNKLLSPAYIDFDLPPSINPDYYFYQPHKMLSINEKKAKFTQLAIKRAIDIYKEYTTQLSPEGSDKGYKIIEEIEKELLIEGREPQAPTMRPTIETVEYVEQLKKMGFNVTEENEREILQYSFNGGRGVNTAMASFKIEVDNNGKLIVSPKKMTSDERQKSFEEKSTLFYSDDLLYNDYSLRKRLANTPASNMDFMRAFPVFKVFIIEEDETEFLAPFRQDFNDMFGINAIQQIRLVEHSDQPADLMTINFIDMTGRFTSAKYKEYANQEKPKSLEVIDTKEENPLKGLILKDGTCIQMRMGYSNDINLLDTKFNGYIVSVEGDNNEYSLICQSYGVELVQSIKNPQEAQDIATFNAETKEILQWAVSQPEVKHFGRWKYNSNSNFQISDDANGVTFFNYKRVRPDGSIARSWTWTKDENEMNIIAPEESAWQGYKNWKDNMEDGMLSYLAVTKWPSLLFNFWSKYYVQNTTLWSVIDEMTYRYPGYVAKVLPFEDRVTLFYGNPDAPYFYRRLNLSEGELVAEERRKLDKITSQLADSQLLALWNSIVNSGTANSPFSFSKEQKTELSKSIGRIQALQSGTEIRKMEFHSVGEEQRELTTKIFRNYHTATSANHIISNRIKADYRDVYTEVQVGYNEMGALKASNFGDPLTNTKIIKMNDFLEEEDIRTTYLAGANITNPTMAYQYGAQQLWRESKKLYKGELIMIGNPKIKPFDYILLFDEATQTYGPVEVAQHVLTLVPGQGMISSIQPNMVSSIRNLVGMSNTQAHNYIAAGSYGVEKMEAGGNDFFMRNFATEQGIVKTGDTIETFGTQAGLGGMALGIAGVASLGVLTAGVAAIGILAMIHINHELLMTAKYRNPIILHPLIRMGAPYIHGMNTYKNLGLTVWTREKWKLLKEDLSVFHDVVKYAIEDMF